MVSGKIGADDPALLLLIMVTTLMRVAVCHSLEFTDPFAANTNGMSI